jgi:hypothetical protein
MDGMIGKTISHCRVVENLGGDMGAEYIHEHTRVAGGSSSVTSA